MKPVKALLLVLALTAVVASGVLAQDFIELYGDYSVFSPAARPYLKQADDLIAAGKYNQALGKLKRAAGVETAKTRTYDIKIREAMLNLYLGRVGYARFLLNRITRLFYYPPALIAAARTYIYYPPYDRNEGKSRLLQVIRKDPKDWQAHLELGYCEFFLGNYAKAKKQFEKTLALNGRAIRACYGLADILFRRKKYMDAVHMLEDALRIDPENAETMKKIGDVFMGSTINRRVDSAISWYDRALEYAQDDPKYYAAVMLAFFARFTAGNTKPYYKKMKQIAPGSTYVRWADGVYLELRGRVGAALEQYEKAVSLDNRNWYAQFSRANIYSGRGNEEYVSWARTANYRYDAHGNTQKGIEALTAIRNNAPTFPFIGVVDDWYHFLMERPTHSPWKDPAFKEKLQRMKLHGQALRKGMY